MFEFNIGCLARGKALKENGQLVDIVFLLQDFKQMDPAR